MDSQLKKILPAILLVISFALFYFSWTIYSEVPLVEIEISDYTVKNTTLTNLLDKVAASADYARKNPDVIDKIGLMLPANDDKPNLLSNFGNMTFLNGLMLKKIGFTEMKDEGVVLDPSQAPPIKDYETQKITLAFNGTYQAYKNFLSSLEQNLKIMDVVSIDFKFSPPTGGNQEEKDDKPKEQPTKSYEFSTSLKTYHLSGAGAGTQNDLASLYNGNDIAGFDFAKGKQFSDLALPQNYKVDPTDAGDLNNKDIF